MQPEARLAPTRARVSRQERADSRREVGHRGNRVTHRTGRAHGRAGAAAHAKMRLDLDVIAVRADRAGGPCRCTDCSRSSAISYARGWTPVREKSRLFDTPTIVASVATACACADRIVPGADTPAAADACGPSASPADRARGRTSRCGRRHAREVDGARCAAPRDAFRWALQRSKSTW